MLSINDIKIILRESRNFLRQSSIIHLPMFFSTCIFLPLAMLIKSNTLALFGLLMDLENPFVQIVGVLWLAGITYGLISMLIFVILLAHCLVIVMVDQYPEDSYKSLKESAIVVIHKMGEIFLFYMLIEFIAAIVFFIHFIPAILILYFSIFTMIAMLTEKNLLHMALKRNVEVISMLMLQHKKLLMGLVMSLTLLLVLSILIVFMPPVSQIPSVFFMFLCLDLMTVVLIKIYKRLILPQKEKIVV